MTSNFVQRGTEIIKIAVEKDNAEEYDSALNLYSRGIEFLMTGMKYEKNQRINTTIKQKVAKYLERAESLKLLLNDSSNNNNTPKANKKRNNNNNNHVSSSSDNKDSKDSKEDNDDAMDNNDETEEDLKLKNAIMKCIVIEKPNIKWEDIAGLDIAKALLQEAVILPIAFPKLFQGKRQPWKGILLYGPPGTGKSYLAKAVATEANNCTFLSVSAADLMSKFVGESERLVKQLFTLARQKKPSIVFIDEIDSLAGKRDDNDNDNMRRVKTEFLVQMDGVGNDDTGVLTLGATNCPWDLDPAIRRRFKKRIYIPLPDKEARVRMFKLNIGDTPNRLKENDLQLLANKTNGFSGSDVAGVVNDALMEPLRTMQSATHFKRIINNNNEIEYIKACSPNDPNATQMTLMQIPNNERDYVEAESLQIAHFLRILQHCKTSVGTEDIERHVHWTREYGQEGS